MNIWPFSFSPDLRAKFKRIGKGHKEVWIQASYNPVRDMNGRPFKVVKFATDVSQQAANGVGGISQRLTNISAATRQIHGLTNQVKGASHSLA